MHVVHKFHGEGCGPAGGRWMNRVEQAPAYSTAACSTESRLQSLLPTMTNLSSIGCDCLDSRGATS